MRIFFFASFFSLLYSQDLFDSITSLLTPTGIQIADDKMIYASTSGGLLQFNTETEEFNFIKTEEGLTYLDLSTISIDRKGRLWLGGASPRGCLQVYDPASGQTKYYKEWKDSYGNYKVVRINKIQIGKIGEDIAFAMFEGATNSEIGILEFQLDPDGLPNYQDYYTTFTDEVITEIRDLDIFQDSVYVTTDQGIFVGNYIEHLYTAGLKTAENWGQVYSGNNARQFVPGDSPLIITDDSILNRQENGSWTNNCPNSFIGKIIQAKVEGAKMGVLTEEYFYEISDCEISSFHIPVGNQNIPESPWQSPWKYDIRTFFTSFDYSGNGSVFIGIKDQGILSLDGEQDSHVLYTPNTAIWRWYTDTAGNYMGINSSRAITVTKSGHLAAVSHFGILYYNGIDFINYIPDLYNDYYSGSSKNFFKVNLDYYPQNGPEHYPISIIEKDNGNLIYCNSGVAGTTGGAVIELDHTSGEIIKYDSEQGIIDGLDGRYNVDWADHYMVVNQIEKDNLGNIWIVNPYCEEYGNLVAIQSATDNNSWAHIYIPDQNSYLPQTIALEEQNSYQRAWIGFEAAETINNPSVNNYSSGGIKVLRYTDLKFDDLEDSTWISIENPIVLPGSSANASIWSIAVDHMGFLWVLSEKGLGGYTVHGNSQIELKPLPDVLFTHPSFIRGNRIKVDSQNNKWIITHHGVWIIQESTLYWPSDVGLHPYNSGLLSDVVYDVVFDNDKGLAYLATDKGISILQIPFANNPSEKESMYISPNPFIVPDDEFVTIKNIPSGSTIQIMTITGIMIKTIELGDNISQTLWDGRTDKGEVAGTAVYLVAAHHPSEPNMVSKIAIIRK